MKALTIKQPYADAIFKGWKPYEIRTRRTHFRGEFVVHAGAKLDKYSCQIQAIAITLLNANTNPYLLPTGAGIGIARIADCVPVASIDRLPYPARAFCPTNYGDWAWQLEVVEQWDTPIPAKGKLGFWEWID